MNILVIGGGGREHAIVWKLNNRGHNIFCAPGNPGIADIAECVSLQVNQMKELADFAQSNKIDLTVVGPEDPLTNGIVDQFEKRSLLILVQIRNLHIWKAARHMQRK
jgi:phosphoribosylamine--glycine ligase (EC 6.3.4.13)